MEVAVNDADHPRPVAHGPEHVSAPDGRAVIGLERPARFTER
jgi:hypothetical protein